MVFFRRYIINIYMLYQKKSAMTTNADNEGTDQPVHAAQADQCLHCLLTESLATVECTF